MKLEFARVKPTQVELTVEVEPDQLEDAMAQAYRKVVKRLNVPGFRKGKVPRQILEAQFGRGVLYEDAVQIIVEATYSDALKEADVEPLEEPKLDVVQLEKDQPFIYKAIVAVKPVIELPQYQGLELEGVPAHEVTEAEIAEVLERMRQRSARLVEVAEGAAQSGDVVVIDFTGFIDGEAFPGGSAEDYQLELGSNTFIPGFEDQLVGAAVGEEKEVNVVFPENYQSEDLAGKDAMFKVAVKGVRRKEVDEINDEFAKDVSEFDTLEELKADLANKLAQNYQDQERRQLKDQIGQKLLDMVEVEAPDALVRDYLQESLNRLNQTLSYQGLSMSKYLEVVGQKPEDLISNMRPEAEKFVQQVLILEAIARQEGLEVPDSEVEQELENMSQMYRLEREQLDKSETLTQRVKRDMMLDRTLNWLLEKSMITVPIELPAE